VNARACSAPPFGWPVIPRWTTGSRRAPELTMYTRTRIGRCKIKDEKLSIPELQSRHQVVIAVGFVQKKKKTHQIYDILDYVKG
jgi:hypothetical protein